MNTKKASIIFLLLACVAGLMAQINLTNSPGNNSFALSTSEKATQIIVDNNDPISVTTAAKLFAGDLELVTGRKAEVKYVDDYDASTIVLVGTVENNELIKQLASSGKLNVSEIEGDWERYIIEVIDNPFPNVTKALVIAGSDRRGAAYGLFAISEEIDVSPWYWWADVAVERRDELHLDIEPVVSIEPTVKYRGVFINDEDWGLLPWAKHTFDPELGDIGPKTYEKVYELLLRLKANYLAPAMHEASGAFNKYPENKVVADSFGIVMGSVHPEPLLFNNASEWDTETMGEWNYMTNKDKIIEVLDKRVEENSPYENVYTLALRGLHDRAMTGDYTLQERVDLVGEALRDQRQILIDHIDKPIEEIPQAFTPYKEVLDLYLAGLDLPEDVILVWPDDNYGYMKQLSNADEQKRSGGSGVYYHASYLGIPHDYLWLASTPPSLMYEELKKAYDTGADRLWLLNAGDIKSAEFPTQLFLDMAYDINKFSFENIADYNAEWLSEMFGEQYYDDFKEITNEYFRLAFIRKPEFMGWGYEWNTFSHGRERNTDTDFSFANYREAETRVEDYKRIGSRVEEILAELPEEDYASFFQLAYYPVKGSELMNRKWLATQQNRNYIAQERPALANKLRDDVQHYYDTLYTISYNYNDLMDGKWKRIMSIRQGVTAAYFEMPKLDSVNVPTTPEMGLFVEGTEPFKGAGSFLELPSFNKFYNNSYFIDIFNKGEGSFQWSVKPSDDWIMVSKLGGTVTGEDRIFVSVDRSSVPVGERVQGHLEFTSGDVKEKVLVSVFNPASPSVEEVRGLFVEDNGVVSIPGADFHRKTETDDVKMQIIENIGFEDRAVMLGDPTTPVLNPRNHRNPGVEYDFYTFHHGSVDVYTYVLPVFPISSDRDFGFHEQNSSQTRYAVSIDDGPVALPSSSSPEYTQTWYENVLRNAAINKSTFHIDKPGKHTLNIRTGDPGMVIQKIVIDFGGMKKSYTGPTPTKVE